MLDSADVDSRSLTTKPVKVSDAGTNNVGTIWMLREPNLPPMRRVRVVVANPLHKGHVLLKAAEPIGEVVASDLRRVALTALKSARQPSIRRFG